MKQSVGLFLCLFCTLTQAHAFSFKTWFENNNQTAARLMEEKQFKAAAATFKNPKWEAVAHYRDNNFKTAEAAFKAEGGEEGFYNQGNALAHLGDYQAAIKAYDKTLKLNPNHVDAKYNRDLLKKLLEQNQDKQQNQDQDKKQDNQDKSEQNKDKKQQDRNNNQQEAQHQKNQQDQKQDEKQDRDKKQHDQSKSKQEQEQNQALRVIPDDPGGLLREKFWRDHWRRLKAEHS